MIKPSQFDVTVDAQRGSVAVSGDLDIATVPLLEQALEGLLAAQAKHVCIDLSALTFADSSGLRLLIAANERSRRGGWTLELLRPPEEAFMVFRVSGADASLPFRGA